jgi:ATP-dependent helicase STH1/SNF2
MEESELPDIYVSEENPVQEVEEEYAGRGARVKTQVKYDDGLTEEQWLAAVDDSDDSIGEAAKRKQARIDKRRTNKAKRERAEGEVSSPEPDRESSEEPEPEPEPQPKKKGRPTKAVGQKRKGEDIEEETPPAKRKRGRQPNKAAIDVLGSAERSALQKALKTVVESIKSLEVPDSDPEEPSDDESDDEPPTRLIIGPFMELPSKKLYADYYTFIAEPIALDVIEKRISGHQYTSLKDLQHDVSLLAKNAKTYNEDGSMIYNDAVVIEVSLRILKCRGTC